MISIQFTRACIQFHFDCVPTRLFISNFTKLLRLFESCIHSWIIFEYFSQWMEKCSDRFIKAYCGVKNGMLHVSAIKVLRNLTKGLTTNVASYTPTDIVSKSPLPCLLECEIHLWPVPENFPVSVTRVSVSSTHVWRRLANIKSSTVMTSRVSNFPRSLVRMFRILFLTNTAKMEVKWKIAFTHTRAERQI